MILPYKVTYLVGINLPSRYYLAQALYYTLGVHWTQSRSIIEGALVQTSCHLLDAMMMQWHDAIAYIICVVFECEEL
jgi:hypothetical protein